MRIIALAGASGSGKSTLASHLARILGGVGQAVVISTSQALRERLRAEMGGDINPTNDQLREFGNRLDRDDPSWPLMGREAGEDRWVIVDAVRSDVQARRLRALGAYFLRLGKGDPRDGTWMSDHGFQVMTGYGDPATQALAVLEQILPRGKCDAVIGAQWGSEGKGKVAAYLATREPYAAMGRAGGPNAGHRVQLPDGSYKVFRHLPSATPYAQPGCVLVIGPGGVVNLDVLRGELPHVPDGVRVVIDPRVAIVDDRCLQAERDAELPTIGSTMTGTGGAMALRVLRKAATFGEMLTPRQGLEHIEVAPAGIALREAACRGRILIEATQGMHLSLLHGRYPHVTSRDVSPSGLLSEMGLPPGTACKWYMVARTYPIRVGGPSGDLPGECTWADVAATCDRAEQDLMLSERTSVTNRLRRVARWERGSLVRSARRAFGRADHVVPVITFADYLTRAPEQLEEILREAAAVSSTGVVLVGNGPRCSDLEVRDIRGWDL